MAEVRLNGQSRSIIELHNLHGLVGCLKDNACGNTLIIKDEIVNIGRGLLLRDGAVIYLFTRCNILLTLLIVGTNDLHIANESGHELLALALTVNDVHLEFAADDTIRIFDVYITGEILIKGKADGTEPYRYKEDKHSSDTFNGNQGEDRDSDEDECQIEQNAVAAVGTFNALFYGIFRKVAGFVIGIMRTGV